MKKEFELIAALAKMGDACAAIQLVDESRECFRLINNLASGVRYASVEREYRHLYANVVRKVYPG